MAYTTYYNAGATSRPVSNFDRDFNRTRDAISTGAKVALGVGITFGVLIIISLIATCCLVSRAHEKRRQRHLEDSKLARSMATPSPVGGYNNYNGQYQNAPQQAPPPTYQATTFHKNNHAHQSGQFGSDFGDHPTAYGGHDSGMTSGGHSGGHGGGGHSGGHV